MRSAGVTFLFREGDAPLMPSGGSFARQGTGPVEPVPYIAGGHFGNCLFSSGICFGFVDGECHCGAFYWLQHFAKNTIAVRLLAGSGVYVWVRGGSSDNQTE